MKTVIQSQRSRRNLINVEDAYAQKYWSRHFGVSPQRLADAIQKVGNSATAVRKQLLLPKDVDLGYSG